VVEMGRDKDTMDSFLDSRGKLIQRMQEGKKGFERGSGGRGGKGPKIKQSQNYQLNLLPPEDDFLPWSEYKKEYRKVLKTGHRKRTINGIAGVMIPAVSGRPWKVQRVHGSKTEKTETIYEQQGDDPGVDSDDAENMYAEMVDDREAAHARAAVGVTMSRLLEMAAQSSPVGKATVSTTPTKGTPVVDAAGSGSKRSLGGIESSSEDEKPRSKRAPAASGSASSRRPARSANAKGPSSGSGGAAQAAPAHSQGQPAGHDGADASDAAAAGTSTSAASSAGAGGPGAGRRAKPIGEVVDEQLKAFNEGGEASLHFGEHGNVALRSLRRYSEPLRVHINLNTAAPGAFAGAFEEAFAKPAFVFIKTCLARGCSILRQRFGLY
jgi:hypothetical protein